MSQLPHRRQALAARADENRVTELIDHPGKANSSATPMIFDDESYRLRLMFLGKSAA